MLTVCIVAKHSRSNILDGVDKMQRRLIQNPLNGVENQNLKKLVVVAVLFYGSLECLFTRKQKAAAGT